MKRNLAKILLFILIGVSFNVLKAADKKKNFFTNYGIGARESIFKTSFVAVGDGYLAGQLNPAGVGFAREIFLGASHARIAFNRQVGFVSAVIPLTRNDKLGIFWKGFLINDIEARSSNSVQPDYLFKNAEQIVGLTYARKFFDRLTLGMTANLLFQSLDQHYASGWGVEFGFMYRIGEKFTLGASLNDYKEKLIWDTSHIDYFEKVGNVGFSYQFAPNALLAFGYRSKNIFSVGTEVRISSPLSLRMSWQDQQIALGLGFEKDLKYLKFQLNYAVMNHQITNGLSHVFEMNFKFSVRQKQKPMAIVRAKRLNVRAGPGINYSVLMVAKRGQKFILIDERKRWVKVKFSHSRFGWVDRRYVKITNYEGL